jgi:cell shape-determining protein MreC
MFRTAIWSVAIILLFVSGFVAWSGGFFHRIGLPLWIAKKNVTEIVTDSSYLVRTKANVFRENQNLIKENEGLKIKMVDHELIVQENTELKELLGRVPVKNSFVLGVILAKPNQSPYDTVVIDAGVDEGLREGEKVFVDGEVPIGTISKVYNGTSLVTLYSNPRQTTEAILEGSNATVSLLGRGGGNFEMSIPIDLPSDKGMHVVLPGLSSEVVAVIEDIISSPTDPLKKVLLRSPVNVQALKWVEVKK